MRLSLSTISSTVTIVANRPLSAHIMRSSISSTLSTRRIDLPISERSDKRAEDRLIGVLDRVQGAHGRSH